MNRPYVPIEQVEMVRGWFRDESRGGVVLWTNKEIGASRGDVITPRLTNDKPTAPPHWAYGNKPERILQPEDLDVWDVTDVPVPPDWFPVCGKCNGSGRRSVQDLAETRHESFASVREACLSGAINVANCDGDMFDCTYCNGTGHVDPVHGGRLLTVRIKRFYWGADLFPTGKDRARNYARRLGDGVEWSWEPIGNGLAKLVFFRRKIEKFTL